MRQFRQDTPICFYLGFCVLGILLVFKSTGCSGERSGSGSQGKIYQVPYLNGAFLPERQAVLVSWLPIQPLPPGFKGYVIYRTPPYAIGTNLTAPVGYTPLGTVTQTSFEDRAIQGNKSYGYAVAITYLDTRSDPLTSWLWVDIPVTYLTVPPEAPIYADPCSEPAHTDSSFAVLPLDATLNPITRAVGGSSMETQRQIKLRFVGYLFTPITVELYYYRYSLFEGIPQTLDLVQFTMPAATCTTVDQAFTLNEIGDSRHTFYRFGYKLSERRFYYLNFPNTNAMEWVYLALTSPPLGSILTPGYHSFAGRAHYRVRSLKTRQLTLFVKGGAQDGNQQYLAVFPLTLKSLEDQLTISGGFVIPEGISEVRFLLAFAGSTPDELLFYDEVDFHVVP